MRLSGRHPRAFAIFRSTAALWFSCLGCLWFYRCFAGVTPTTLTRLRGVAGVGTLSSCRLSGCQRQRRQAVEEEGAESSASAAPSLDCITPIGPFSPFRSSACSFDSELGKGMTDLTTSSPEFAVEMSRMQLDMQMGREPEPERMRKLADGLEASHQKWQELMTRLQLSG